MPNFPVDEPLLRRLAELMNETDLSEIELTLGRQRIRLARGARPLAPPPEPLATPAPPASPGPALAEPLEFEPEPEVQRESGPEEFVDYPGAIASPMVGTLYVSATKGGPPLISVGNEVSEGDQVFIIEAMKTMNPVLAPRGGTVTRIFVEDAQPVEFGAMLAVIE